MVQTIFWQDFVLSTGKFFIQLQSMTLLALLLARAFIRDLADQGPGGAGVRFTGPQSQSGIDP